MEIFDISKEADFDYKKTNENNNVSEKDIEMPHQMFLKMINIYKKLYWKPQNLHI